MFEDVKKVFHIWSICGKTSTWRFLLMVFCISKISRGYCVENLRQEKHSSPRPLCRYYAAKKRFSSLPFVGIFIFSHFQMIRVSVVVVVAAVFPIQLLTMIVCILSDVLLYFFPNFLSHPTTSLLQPPLQPQPVHSVFLFFNFHHFQNYSILAFGQNEYQQAGHSSSTTTATTSTTTKFFWHTVELNWTAATTKPTAPKRNLKQQLEMNDEKFMMHFENVTKNGSCCCGFSLMPRRTQ